MKASNHEMNPLHDVQPEDAIGMLIADHKRVANLFADYQRLTDEDGKDKDKAAVVVKICQELAVHAELEEQLFYPAVRAAIDDDDQMDEALIEHAGAKSLIAQLESAAPSDDLYDAKVTVLRDQIDHHVEEEEGSMFPKARHAGIDTAGLGAQMLKRKSELMSGEVPLSAALPKADSAAADADETADAAVPITHKGPPRKNASKSKAPKKSRR